MAKKIFTLFILGLSFFMPIFGVIVHIPWNSNYTPNNSDYNAPSHASIWNGVESEDSQDMLLNFFSYINEYLRWAFSVICTAVVIYWWYRLITSNRKKKALKQWIWALIWSAIGVVIAMLSYMLVHLMANLKF